MDRRRERIVALRRARGVSLYQIQQQLAEEGNQVSTGYIQGIFEQEGIQRLARLPPHLRSVRALRSVTADRQQLDLSPRSFRTDFGGWFLLAFDLACMNLDPMLAEIGMPGAKMIPARCAVRSLLALKLSGVGRPSQVMAETLDEGLGLFAGLKVIPQRSKLTEFSVQIDPRFALALMDTWMHAVGVLEPSLHSGRSFDLDFHPIPSHGDQILMQAHFASK